MFNCAIVMEESRNIYIWGMDKTTITDMGIYFSESYAIEYAKTLDTTSWGQLINNYVYHYTRKYDGTLNLEKVITL